MPCGCRFDAEENSSGSLTRCLATDTSHLRGALGDAMGQAAQSLAGVILALGLAFSNGWKLALVVLSSMPVLVAVMGVQSHLVALQNSQVT